MGNAFDEIIRVNHRRPRAMAMTSMVMDVLAPILDRYPQAHEDNAYKEIGGKLMELFSAAGVEIITDADRARWGLPPRGPDGLTVDEAVKIEQARLDAMYRPIIHPITL